PDVHGRRRLGAVPGRRRHRRRLRPRARVRGNTTQGRRAAPGTGIVRGPWSVVRCKDNSTDDRTTDHGPRTKMILEGLVTTRSPQGAMPLAPMGPRVDEEMRRFLLRPFPPSQPYRNLLAHPEGVLHVTDDALLLAQAAIGAADPSPPYRPAS